MESSSSLERFVCDSNESLALKLVRKVEDLEDDKVTFKPQMTHQVFGDNETIFGYRDLKVKLYYTAGGLSTYLGMSYEEKVDPQKSSGVQADDVLGKVAKFLPPGYFSNIDDFSKQIPKECEFKPFGELLDCVKIEQNNGVSERVFEIYTCDVTTPGFQDYHARLQTFILWFIDAASFIDIDDDHWKFFVMYEKYTLDGLTRYAIIGYVTVYEFYAYPENIRPRISQMLVLPPFQRLSLGAELLDAVYKLYIPDPRVIDITVEDPSEEFQRVRDYVDAKNCQKLLVGNPNIINSGFAGVAEEFKKLKLSKKQIRRVYEILKLQLTNTENEKDYQTYRLEVKRRLNLPYQKEQKGIQKIQKVMNLQEYGVEQSVLNVLGDKDRIEMLSREYQELENHYRQILQRLSLD